MITYRMSSFFDPDRRFWSAFSDWLQAHTYPPRWMPPRWGHPAIGYLVAVLLALIAAGVTLLLEVLFAPLVLQGTLLAVVIVFVALNWGEGPSLLVTVIGALLLAFVALPPHFSWEIDDRSEAMGFFLFVITAVMMNLIASQAGRARQKSEYLALEAEEARRRTEELADLLRQAHQQSEQGRQYLQKVLAVLPVGVTLVDPQLSLLQMNTAMLKLWDRKAPPIGEHIRMLGKGWWLTKNGMALEPEGSMIKALQGGEAILRQEIAIETVGGQRKTILHSAAPIQDEGGVLLGGVVAETDITDHKRLEEQLRAAKAQMDAFVAIISHELKTPLTVLKGQLQVTRRRLELLTNTEVVTPPEQAKQVVAAQTSLAHSQQQTRRLERLVNDLVEASRIHTGNLELHMEQVNLVELIHRVVEEQRAASSRVIQESLSSNEPELIVADADRIEQVLTNYLTNALKYSPEEEPVVVGLDLAAEQARVWVHDSGPGIPREEQEQIWERFHRVPGIEVQSGSGIGLGLGLSICREMIERHQGQVGVNSAPGEGTTFWFSLPR